MRWDDELCYTIKRVQHKWFYCKVVLLDGIMVCCDQMRRKQLKTGCQFKGKAAVFPRILAYSASFWRTDYRSCGSPCVASINGSPNIHPQVTVKVCSCHIEKCKQLIQRLINRSRGFYELWLVWSVLPLHVYPIHFRCNMSDSAKCGSLSKYFFTYIGK